MSKLQRLFFTVIMLMFFISLVLVLVLFLCLSSCTVKVKENEKEQQEWNEIINVGADIDAVLDFVRKYEDTGNEMVKQANIIIQKYISDENSVDALNNLLSKYPERETEFKDKIAEIAFNSAISANTADSLENFISTYGKDYPDMAVQAGSFIDDLDWETAVSVNTLESYDDYINKSMSLSYDFNHEGKYIGEADKKIEEIDWDAAYKKALAKSDETVLSLLDFIDSHPLSSHCPEAEQLVKDMLNDSSYFQEYSSPNTLESIEKFILNFPGHKDMEKAEMQRKIYEGDIYDFTEKNYLKVKITGKSIKETVLTVKNNTVSQLIIHIPFGTYFAANNGYVQNMAVTKETSFRIDSAEEKILIIDTAGMNINKDIPTESDFFSVDILESDSSLVKLLKILDQNSSKYEVAQTAIWYMRDNPGKNMLLNTLEYPDGTKAVTESDYNEAVRLADLVDLVDLIED